MCQTKAELHHKKCYRIEKTRIKSKIIKKHSAPQTPFQRLLNPDSVGQEQKEKLIRIYETLDPFL